VKEIWLRYNLRNMNTGFATSDLYQIALEQIAWADRQDCFASVALGEHHGSPDGFNPSPLMFGAAIAARTSKLRIHPSAILLPLHDPVRIAEDMAVLDNMSNGRLDVTLGLGYVASELAMFGVAQNQRARLMDEKLVVLRRALAGEKFEHDGRKIFVTPRPVQQPTPRLFVGGAVAATALRAARLGDGFCPAACNAELIQTYRDECTKLGKPPGTIVDASGPFTIYVAEDVEAAWAQFGPYALHEMRSYSRWAAQGGARAPFSSVDTIEQLRSTGVYAIVTPDECVELIRAQWDGGRIATFHPLTSGLPADLSWANLELFIAKVLPRLTMNSLKLH
jgi:alkanesulfonate monooxygenase SsuD/methylene tetrahydromethanopterin reductase-like flavin-dependent oxidoreductase (luciferase family)